MKQGRVSNAAPNLFPGYFALVMATGIISIARVSIGDETRGLAAVSDQLSRL